MQKRIVSGSSKATGRVRLAVALILGGVAVAALAVLLWWPVRSPQPIGGAAGSAPAAADAGLDDSAVLSLAEITRLIQWEVPLGEAIQGVPAIGAEGVVLVSGSGGTVFAVADGGTPVWQYSCTGSVDEQPAALSSPVAGKESMVFVTSGHRLIALSAAGELLWEYPFEGGTLSAPAVAPNGSVVVKQLVGDGVESGRLHAITAEGELKWMHDAKYPLSAAPVQISSDGRIYDLGMDGGLSSYNRIGVRGWGVGLKSGARGPVIQGTSVLYLVSRPDPEQNDDWLAIALISHSRGSEEKWSFGLPAGPVCDPVIGPEGRGYFGSAAAMDGEPGPDRIFAVSRSGGIDWQCDLAAVEALISLSGSGGVCVLTEQGATVLSAEGEVRFILDAATGNLRPLAAGTGGILYCERDESLVALNLD